MVNTLTCHCELYGNLLWLLSVFLAGIWLFLGVRLFFFSFLLLVIGCLSLSRRSIGFGIIGSWLRLRLVVIVLFGVWLLSLLVVICLF